MDNRINTNSILKFVRGKGGIGNVMEALSWDSSRFEEGFAIANDLQNRDLVKLLYSNFNKNLVVVELTLPGQEAAEPN